MKLSLLLAALVLLPWSGGAERKPGEAAVIRSVNFRGNVNPGARVTAMVQVELEPGFHVHSNKPSGAQFIATELSLEPPSGVAFGKIAYPKGARQKVEGLDRPLSVYEGTFSIAVPVRLGADVALPATIPAVLNYQACRGAQCFPPQSLKFEIILGGKK